MQEFKTANKLTPQGKQQIVYVDIDETISKYDGERRYDLATPIPENIAKINRMYNDGCKIVYWTARGSTSGIDYYNFTWKQLQSWGAKFHKLICGKAKGHFDLLIDDKAKRIEEVYPAELTEADRKNSVLLEHIEEVEEELKEWNVAYCVWQGTLLLRNQRIEKLETIINDLGSWLSAAIDDPKVCDEFKAICYRVLEETTDTD